MNNWRTRKETIERGGGGGGVLDSEPRQLLLLEVLTLVGGSWFR